MLLAELEVWHSRPITPTRRVALGHLVLPADPAPGFGGLLLGAVAAAFLDAGLVDDLALVKLLASLRRRWPTPGETAEILAPYGEWQGLASVFLMQGFKRGLVPGASADRARLVRATARNAA